MIRKEIFLPAGRDEVWGALTEPERLADWFANEVEIDLRRGGRVCFRWENGEERRGTLTEVDPEERLAFTWEDDGEVEFTLTEAEGGTQLEVVETSPAWTIALDLQASSLARA
jgi:uncharacterized protein YndB with AHSA1/START domain